ncbi:MAG: hypothetical protein IJD16_04670 [Desulfovibrio sp.]|nr:hypothetical protein [Desulfovibrio sp.]
MAFTEQDLQKQIEEFAALKEEFSRLEAQEKQMRKTLGLPEEGGAGQDMNCLSPELRAQMETAMADAKRAGEARAAQSSQARVAAGSRPGAARRGVVRL